MNDEVWTHGYNSCLHLAISALNHLSSHPRPSGGQEAYNAEHLLQIADEIKRTIAHNVKVAGTGPAQRPLPAAAQELSLKHDWCPACHRGWNWTAVSSTYGVAPADRIEAAAKIIWPGGFDKESGSEAQRHEAREKAKRVLALTSTERTRPFYGAECPSYPVCEGGCGLGCTKEIERTPAISHPTENIEPGA